MENNNHKNSRSVIDTLILSLMVALFMIGIHQIYVIGQAEGFKSGFFKSYYIFMLIVILMAVQQIRKNKRIKEEAGNSTVKETQKKKAKSSSVKR